MADNDGTESTEDQAPAEGAPVEGSQTQDTTPKPDEVTTLRSRNAGLDAKVTSLSAAQKAEKARADAAEAKLQEYIGGKAVEDDDTRALIQRLSSELDTQRAVAKVASIAAKYPETFSVIGDGVGSMSDDQLAAAEARFMGIPVESNRPPTPVGNSAARPATGVKTIEEMSLAELKDYAGTQYGNLKWPDLAENG